MLKGLQGLWWIMLKVYHNLPKWPNHWKKFQIIHEWWTHSKCSPKKIGKVKSASLQQQFCGKFSISVRFLRQLSMSAIFVNVFCKLILLMLAICKILAIHLELRAICILCMQYSVHVAVALPINKKGWQDRKLYSTQRLCWWHILWAFQ